MMILHVSKNIDIMFFLYIVIINTEYIYHNF